jgi:hypothetical protein
MENVVSVAQAILPIDGVADCAVVGLPHKREQFGDLYTTEGVQE